jgi:hypothetical protein
VQVAWWQEQQDKVMYYLGGKVEAILESEKYETLTVDELFSKL